MKKKLILVLVALVCVLCCVFGLVACGDKGNGDGNNNTGNNNSTSNNNSGNNNQSGSSITGPEVTASQWAEILNGVDKFTIDMTWQDPEDPESEPILASTIKIDGAKRSQSMGPTGDNEIIFVKDGDNYYEYEYSTSTSSWIRSDFNQGDYDRYTGHNAKIASYFKEDYSAFTYSNGAYTVASLDKTTDLNGVITNVKITFSNGALVGIKFDAEVETAVIYTFVIKDVGTTTISLPENYSISVRGTYYIYWENEGTFVYHDGEIMDMYDNGTWLFDGDEGTYTVNNGIYDLLFIEYQVHTYAKIDGNVIWLYDVLEDVDDMTKVAGFAYKGGVEISATDKTKIETLTGCTIADPSNGEE